MEEAGKTDKVSKKRLISMILYSHFYRDIYYAKYYGEGGGGGGMYEWMKGKRRKFHQTRV